MSQSEQDEASEILNKSK